jgi:hypothetical protein
MVRKDRHLFTKRDSDPPCIMKIVEKRPFEAFRDAPALSVISGQQFPSEISTHW